MIKITHQVTSTNWEVKEEEEEEEGEGNICITRIHIWTTTEQDLSTQRKMTQNRYGNLAITKQRPETPSLLWFRNHDKGSTMKHIQLSQKNTARGRDRSGASGPWITITRPRVDRMCTCEGTCGCERETSCACNPTAYTRNNDCACFRTPPASLVCYQWSGPTHLHTFRFELLLFKRHLLLARAVKRDTAKLWVSFYYYFYINALTMAL